MSQWREVLRLLENATGGWATTHEIRDELDIVNVPERINEIRTRGGVTIETEYIQIKGKRAARYRIAHDRKETPCADSGVADDGEGGLFPRPAPTAAPNRMWEAA